VTPATGLTILILLAGTVALMVGMERLAAHARRWGQVRGGQQLGPPVHPGRFAERFRHHLLRTMIVLVPALLAVAYLQSEAS
jgi:hypothetical protein